MSTDREYTPPTTQVGSGTRAFDASGTTVNIAGGSNQPDPGSATVAAASGSPTEESGLKYVSTVVSLSPNTLANTVTPDPVCTVTGTLFGPNTRVVYGGSLMPTTYVSATSLTFILPAIARVTTGVVAVGVQSGARLSPTVNFTWT